MLIRNEIDTDPPAIRAVVADFRNTGQRFRKFRDSRFTNSRTLFPVIPGQAA